MNTDVLIEGVARIRKIALEIDQHYGGKHSLHCFVTDWCREDDLISNPYSITNIEKRIEQGSKNIENASYEVAGLMLEGLVAFFGYSLYLKKLGDLELYEKFIQFIPHLGPLSNLRSPAGCDIWMLLLLKVADTLDHDDVTNFFIQNNWLPQQCHDRNQNNLTDYLIFHRNGFFDEVFEPLENILPVAWWKNSIENSEAFESDCSMWISKVEDLSDSEAVRAQKILDHYFALSLREEVDEISNCKTSRKAKI